MADTSLTKLSGVFALLSAASAIGAIIIGVSSGGGPAAINFGDPDTLASLRQAGRQAQVLELLALIGPTLALGAGLGWRQLLSQDGAYVSLGVLLWYLGMIFVIGQDAAELALVFHLPWIYAANEGAAAASVLAFGDIAGEIIHVFMLLGDFISFFGLALISVALLRRRGGWKLIGAAGALSAILICAGLAVPVLAPTRLLGFILFMGWMIAMGVAMLRWRPAAA